MSVPVPTTPTNPADLLRQVAEHAPKVLPERIVKPLLSALTFLAKAGHDSHHPWLAGRLARGVLALPEPSAVPATQDVDLLEVLPVVEDLVERQRQILGALVATTHPLKNDVQAVLLGLRGVVTKLRNGAADTTAPDARDDLLASIWLYVRWRYVTKHLTTEQKELWADAVDESDEPGPKADRWWRDVPGLNVDCTADEAACVHGQTADLTGLATREDTR